MVRFRFRLITLFAVMSVVAIGAAAYGMYQRAIQAEHRALTKIAAKGGFVLVYEEGGSIHFPQPKGIPGLCGTGLVKVYSPTGSPQDFTDADLPLFDDVHQKFHISFEGTQVSPAALQTFKQRHPNLQVDQ